MKDASDRLVSDIESLAQLGSNVTEYKQQGPSAAMLETFKNPQPERDFVINHDFGEFTSLCPKTGQPDFAKILIKFIPHQLCVETKSLKLYFFAYRNEGTFMEAICNQIMKDLIVAMDPKWIHVEAAFAPRGGIHTTIDCEHTRNPIE